VLSAESRLDIAAKVLRILHVRDLRELQTAIDEFLVVVQTLSAEHVRIDSSLGQVGY